MGCCFAKPLHALRDRAGDGSGDVEVRQSLLLGGRPKHKDSDLEESDVEAYLDDSPPASPLPGSFSGAAVPGGDAGDGLLLSPGDPKRVRFGEASVREFKRCMDWHPCVSSGVPLGLDWVFEDLDEVSLDLFEQVRFSQGRINRQEYPGRGRLEPRVRMSLALEAGHEPDEVAAMARRVDALRGGRYVPAAAGGGESGSGGGGEQETVLDFGSAFGGAFALLGWLNSRVALA